MIDFYKEILDAFIAKDVRFVLIGGYAVNAYGFQRTTGDMDLLVDPKGENLNKIYKCLGDAGFDADEAKRALSQPGGILFLKEEPYRIDLLTKINIPYTFDEVYSRAETRKLFEITIKVIGYSDLIDEKSRSKRNKDLLDIATLEEIRRSRGASDKNH